jgi:hypothetical protein
MEKKAEQCKRIRVACEQMEKQMGQMDVKEDWKTKIHEIHDHLIKAEEESDLSKVEDLAGKLEQVANASEKMLAVVDAVKSGDIHSVILSTMSTISAFAVLAGPYGAVVSGVLQIACVFYKYIITGATVEDSLPTKIRKIVRDEVTAALKKYKFDNLSGKVAAWIAVEDKIQDELNRQMAHKSKYSKYDPKRCDDITAIRGELGREIAKVVKDEHEAARCVTFMMLYVKISVPYLAMLTSHLSLALEFEQDSDAETIRANIETLKSNGRQLFGFLSDKTLLSAAGMIDDRKRLKMIAYAALEKSYEIDIINGFCTEILGLPQPEYTHAEACKSSVTWPIHYGPKSIEKQCQDNDHYFVLVNSTKLPISVFSGTAGDDVQNLEFQEVVKPNGGYHRMCTKGSMFTDFKAGGVFCFGSDAKTYGDVEKAQLIQFAMYYHNPMMVGAEVSKIKTIVCNTPGNPHGNDALKGLQGAGDDEDVVNFWYAAEGKEKELFLLKAQSNLSQEGGQCFSICGSNTGKRSHRIYRFCITQTTLDELRKK